MSDNTHIMTSGVSNSADCSCGESFHGVTTEDLVRAVDSHLRAVGLDVPVKTYPFQGPRGLKGYTAFDDTYGYTVEVAQSSAGAMIDGGAFVYTEGTNGSHCWLRIEGAEEKASAHLNREMAVELILALSQFVKDSE